jgi:hypothetical protein
LKNNEQTSITQISHLAPEKGDEAKKQAPSKQTQRKINSKAGLMVNHRADLWNLKTRHTTEGEAD